MHLLVKVNDWVNDGVDDLLSWAMCNIILSYLYIYYVFCLLKLNLIGNDEGI